MSRKVFSIYAWYKSCGWETPIEDHVRTHNWVLECEGKEKSDCPKYILVDSWFVDINEYTPYKLNTNHGHQEDTFVINLQFTRILKRDSYETPLPNEVIGENIRKYIEGLIKHHGISQFDDIKVTSVQHFEHDLVNSDEG